MEVRYPADPQRVQIMDTASLRENFLVTNLFKENSIELLYSHVDRAIIGSAVPIEKSLKLKSSKKEMAAEFFCERRELGVFNIGNSGSVEVDGQAFELDNRDVLYVSMGSQKISFMSKNAKKPAKFYLISYPAHKSYKTKKIGFSVADQTPLGTPEASNKRIIYKYIHGTRCQSCQLVMGFTQLDRGSVWNTMPPHTHQRRSEVYLYFDLDKDAVVVHLMGEPDKTRSLIIREGQAAISPSWSVHCGAGTSKYAFIWAMGGENQEFDDMDGVPLSEIL